MDIIHTLAISQTFKLMMYIKRIMSSTFSQQYLFLMLLVVLFAGSALLFNLLCAVGRLVKSIIFYLKLFQISNYSISSMVYFVLILFWCGQVHLGALYLLSYVTRLSRQTSLLHLFYFSCWFFFISSSSLHFTSEACC